MIAKLETYLQSEGGSQETERLSFSEYPKVQFVQRIGNLTRRRYCHHTIRPGDFIQCYSTAEVDEDGQLGSTFMEPSEIGLGKLMVFQVKFIIGGESSGMWTAALYGLPYCDNVQSASMPVDTEAEGTSKSHCDSDENSAEELTPRDNVYTFRPFRQNEVVLLKLTKTVRKAFGLHACDLDSNGCCIDTTQKTISHRLPKDKPSSFTVLTRPVGFPPRRS